MINILPEEGRRIARAEYRLRLITVATLAGAVVALSAGALLFPSYISSRAAAEVARQEAARLADAKQKRGETTDAPLALAEAELKAFASLIGGTVPSVAIGLLLSERGAGISITQIRYDAALRKATLSGRASTRDRLLLFVQELRKAQGVESADVPVSDLARSENAPFSITVIFAQSKP